ncbi:hypothetical protein CJF42_21450 [Pseudoalteromonas sp. NBT06-2]|uniref:hypothetical protein n=1 Tax=Pseudoalteromonas sp. NBT06-2 TaxID=2025950 RepID=UPI000BA78AF4|nr:hypothetical protein [Pseudoalteromonas sp. NBT06-2]PAJ72403.1 hypothetical protein CJF42_21450 [Pseudoalteromonas sp. NBT06-2]
MKKIISILLLFFYSSISFASTTLKICNTCSSDSSFEFAAKAEAELGTSSIVKVLNLKDGTIRQFNVELEPLEPGYEERGGVVLNESQVSSADIELATEAVSNKTALRGFFDANSDIPSDVLTSGYATIGRSYNVTALMSYYNNNLGAGQKWSVYWSSLLVLAGKVVNAKVYVSLKFSDGSTLDVKFTGLDSSGNVIFEPLRLIDKDGNIVPLDEKAFKANQNNTYKFSTVQGLQQYLDAAGRYGISVVNVANIPTGTGSVSDIRCDDQNKCRKIN